MFKQIKIVVWTAFFAWMAFFLFSFDCVQAQTPAAEAFSEPSAQAVVNQLNLYKSHLCSGLLFDAPKGSQVIIKCHDSNVPTPSGSTVSTTEARYLFLQETNNLCSAGANNEAKTDCWETAGGILSDSFSSGCRPHTRRAGDVTDAMKACLSSAFREEAADAEKMWTEIKNRGEQGINEAVLRDFGRALCSAEDKEPAHRDFFFGLMIGHTDACDRTVKAMIDDSVENGQIPSNDDQVKADEAGLSFKVCTANKGDSSKNPRLWSALRLTCFQNADVLYGGVSRAPAPDGCTDEDLNQHVSDAPWSTILSSSRRAEFLARFTTGASCYEQLFYQAAAGSSSADSLGLHDGKQP